MAEYNFPTETIDLPSQGKFYPEGHPLQSGKIDIKYMTAKHEDILTSTNLIQKGTVLDKLMDELIATPGVKSSELVTGDINAVMVAARILAYGKDYPIEITCGECGTKFTHPVDLAKLNTMPPGETQESNEYMVTLPTGMKLTFRPLTRGDEKLINEEVQSIKKISNIESDTSTRLKYIITSVNGNRDKKVIREFADAMIIRDVRALREEIRKVSPDVDFNLSIACSACENQIKVRMPIGANFFWPDIGL
jgi:hypothetical protein